MIKLLKMQKNKGRQILSLSKGFTYVELIVVLAIFAVMSSIVLFNYGEFQAKVDIKSLASDIALKIVGAQKSAMSGNLSVSFGNLKPSYGVYFYNPTVDNFHFIYFADLNNNNVYDSTLDKILDTTSITKNNRILGLVGTGCVVSGDLGIVFRRPDSSAKISSNNVELSSCTYIQITIVSPRSATATAIIKVYPSGRVQVN